VLLCVLRLRTPPPAEEGSDTTTCLVALCGSLASSVKKVSPAMQLDSRVPEVHTYDSATVAGKGRMRLTSTVVIIKVSITCGQMTIVQR
jgi:hypothetical protein